jgi:hypothetical protein
MTTPYTHRDHATLCGAAGRAGVVLSGVPVQARIGRTLCCARIVTAWDTPDGVEMWKLDLQGPIHGLMSTPTRNVRQCAGLDGRCTCAPASLEGLLAGGRQAQRATPPEGSEGVTCL